MTYIFYAVKICAKKDRNGNTRHCWVVFEEDGELYCVVDEGPKGNWVNSAVEMYKGYIDSEIKVLVLLHVETKTFDYNFWIEEAKQRNCLVE